MELIVKNILVEVSLAWRQDRLAPAGEVSLARDKASRQRGEIAEYIFYRYFFRFLT